MASGKSPSRDLPAIVEPGQTAVTEYSGAATERRRYKEINFVAAPPRPPITRIVIGGMLLFAVFFGGFGAWATMAPLSSAAHAVGRMVVESKRRTVQHFEGGIIDELLVSEGQRVKKGDVLLRIAPEQSALRTDAFTKGIVSAEANSARLRAHLAGLEAPEFPPDLLERQDDPTVASVLAAQRSLFASTNRNLREQQAVRQQRIDQFESQIAGLEQQVVSTNRQLALSREELAGLQSLLAENLTQRSRVLAVQRQVAEIENRRDQTLAAIDQAREAISGTEIEIAQLETQSRETWAKELEENRSQLVDLGASLRSAEDLLRRTEIRAPVAGRVVDLQFFTVGGVVRSGERILDIVPEDDLLVVEARIDPADIDVVHEGQESEVRLTSFKLRTTPTVPGTLTNISADLISDQFEHIVYYRAIVRLEPTIASHFDLYPGMPVEVMIKLRDRTFLDYILAPLTESFARAFLDQ